MILMLRGLCAEMMTLPVRSYRYWQRISLPEMWLSRSGGDLAACQRIVEGTQYMTAFKPIEDLARITEFLWSLGTTSLIVRKHLCTKVVFPHQKLLRHGSAEYAQVGCPNIR